MNMRRWEPTSILRLCVSWELTPLGLDSLPLPLQTIVVLSVVRYEIRAPVG